MTFSALKTATVFYKKKSTPLPLIQIEHTGANVADGSFATLACFKEVRFYPNSKTKKRPFRNRRKVPRGDIAQQTRPPVSTESIDIKQYQ